MANEQTHPYVKEELDARAKSEEARQQRDTARKRAKDFEGPWSANTAARIRAEQGLEAATGATPLAQIVEWQATATAALFLDAKFRTEHETLLQATTTAEQALKRARHAHEDVLRNIEIWRNEQADLRHAQMEAEIEAEVRATRTRKRAELTRASAL